MSKRKKKRPASAPLSETHPAVSEFAVERDQEQLVAERDQTTVLELVTERDQEAQPREEQLAAERDAIPADPSPARQQLASSETTPPPGGIEDAVLGYLEGSPEFDRMLPRFA